MELEQWFRHSASATGFRSFEDRFGSPVASLSCSALLAVCVHPISTTCISGEFSTQLLDSAGGTDLHCARSWVIERVGYAIWTDATQHLLKLGMPPTINTPSCTNTLLLRFVSQLTSNQRVDIPSIAFPTYVMRHDVRIAYCACETLRFLGSR